jgi:hypothetical protein
MDKYFYWIIFFFNVAVSYLKMKQIVRFHICDLLALVLGGAVRPMPAPASSGP